MAETNEDNIIGIEVNSLYILSQAMDLILRDCERRMDKQKCRFQQKKKQNFTRYMNLVRQACVINEDLNQDIIDHEAKRNYKDYHIWQEQANEMARYILMFADRSRYIDIVNGVFKYLEDNPGDGFVTEEVLKNFYLKTL